MSLPLEITTRNMHVALFPLLSVKVYLTIDSPIWKDVFGVWVLDTRTGAPSLSIAVGSVHTMSMSFMLAGAVSSISDGQPWITGGVVSRSVQVNKGQDFGAGYHFSDPFLRPGPTAAITRTITIRTPRERVLLVELLHTEYAHAHSTNGMRSLCVVIGIRSHYRCSGTGPLWKYELFWFKAFSCLTTFWLWCNLNSPLRIWYFRLLNSFMQGQ